MQLQPCRIVYIYPNVECSITVQIGEQPSSPVVNCVLHSIHPFSSKLCGNVLRHWHSTTAVACSSAGKICDSMCSHATLMIAGQQVSHRGSRDQACWYCSDLGPRKYNLEWRLPSWDNSIRKNWRYPGTAATSELHITHDTNTQ